MAGRVVRTLRGWGGILLLVIGCSKPQRTVWPDVPPLVPVYIEVSEGAAKSDSGNMAAMLDAIESDFREDGRRVEIVVARPGERAPVPRLEIQVIGSDGGDSEMRKAGHLVPGIVGGALLLGSAGTMTVDAFIVRGGDRARVHLGRFEGSSSTAMSEEAVAAGERTGHAIARRALK